MQNENNIQHIAIVLDGNRRWATDRGLPKVAGHTEGAKNLRRIGELVRKLNIPYLTIWGLSTENLKNRSEDELKHLFSLFEQLVDYLGDFFKNGARCRLIGDISVLPEKTQKKLQEVVEKTKDNKAITLTIAINYGGRDEIVRAYKKMLTAGIDADVVSESVVEQYLDTAGYPEVDLVIRTGGHHRLSGWLPWQCTYAELYFTDVYWPDFNESELNKALEWFRTQVRNRGK